MSAFHDALGYYPGAEFVSRGPVGHDFEAWMTKQWDASAVVPAKEFYGVKAPGYQPAPTASATPARLQRGRPGAVLLRLHSGLGYAGGSGNPGDSNADYGWHVQILEQTDKTAKLAIWNAHHFGVYAPNKTVALSNEKLTYTYRLNGNEGDDLNLFACAPLDPAKVAYVAGSATNGAVPWTMPCREVNARLAAGQDLTPPSTVASDPVVSVVWVGYVPTGGSASFAFDVTPKIIGTLDDMNLELDWGGPDSVTLPAPLRRSCKPSTTSCR